MKRRAGALLLGAAAAALETHAIGMLLGLAGAAEPGYGLLLHAAAVACCGVAAWLRSGVRGVELDITLTLGATLPLLGPALAWLLPRAAHEPDVLDAHAAFEAVADSDAPQHRVSAYSGDYDRDLSRELNTLSYQEVLRRGTLEQKRNLVRTLGRRAAPRHVEMIRTCLDDEDQEIRLCAYAEVDRLGRRHEDLIAQRKLQVHEARDPVEVVATRTALAQAQLDFAQSQILDEEMSRYWAREAIRKADEALTEDPEQWTARLVAVAGYCELGDFAAAHAHFEQLDRVDRDRPDAVLARARTAFLERDFSTARTLSKQLRGRGIDIPEWLGALGDGALAELNKALWS